MSNRTTFHLASRVYGQPLLVEPSKAETILAALGPRIGLPQPDQPAAFVPDARPMPEAAPYALVAGVAVIPVMGTLLHRGSFITAASGVATYQRVAAAFDEAMADPQAKAILLEIDSGGGEVPGCFDLADRIFAARGRKPLWAVANEAAFSAAYALASACDRLTLTRTAGVGSVGVIAYHYDVSAADEDAGVKVTTVSAGARKNDLTPHEPITDEARAALQARVDDVYALFVRTVARNRSLSEEAVRATEAALYWGDAAVTARLADAVATCDQTLRELVAKVGGDPAEVQARRPVDGYDDEADDEFAKPASTAPTATAPAAAPPADQPSPRRVAAEIVTLCREADAVDLTQQLIAACPTVAEARSRLEHFTELRHLVGCAIKVNPAIDAQLARQLFDRGLSLESARHDLFDRLVTAQSPEIVNAFSRDAEIKANGGGTGRDFWAEVEARRYGGTKP